MLESEEHGRLERLFRETAEIEDTGSGKMIPSPTVTPEFACGLYISIDAQSEQIMIDALMKPARKKIEVAVRYLSVTKEFTFADFFRRLGFYDKKDSS